MMFHSGLFCLCPSLQTFDTYTTVFTEEGAGMEVKYVADTKLYIDKKFDQLAAAMLT